MGAVVAIAATYFALKDVNGPEILAALSSAHYAYLLPALIITFVGYFARAWRWQLMIDPVRRIPFKTVFPLLVIGFAWNYAIPLRIGELVRAHLLGQRANLSRSLLLATIVVERVLDGVAIVALLSLVGWLHPALPDWVYEFTRVASVLFGIALLGLLILMLSEPLALRLLRAITAHLPHALGARINNLALSFVRGYDALRSPSRLLMVMLATLVGWAVEAASYAVLFPAFSLSFDASSFVSASAFYAVVLNLTTLIPSSPGFVGTTHYFGKLALSVFDVEPATALSLTVIAHAVQLLVILSLGAWALWREGLSVKRLEQVTVEVE